MQLIDTHCHPDYFGDQLPAVVQRASEAFVTEMIACGTNPADWPIHLKNATTYSNIHYTVGIHPTNIDNTWEQNLEVLETYCAKTPKPVAIGEIGLDYHEITGDTAAIIASQKEVFRQQLLIAKRYDLPVVVHSRNAFDDCLTIIEQAKVDWHKIVVHCFSEGPGAINRLNARGARGSFTGIITYKSAENVRQALLTQGIERLMLETDSPYLAPVPYRSKQNEPAYVRAIANFAANLLRISEEELSSITTRNARAFFNL
ncbi:MAG: TatD family hydrolase [Verrucomicrobiota bacterium]|nr:MAG: TatD family hydrolase [Verrucomicrobiota bacterium]